MSKVLNFNNVNKRYLTVILADGHNTTLMIGTPTKAIMNDLMSLQTGLEAMKGGESNEAAIDDLYIACAKIMSRNKTGVKVTVDQLENLFDYEDILLFFNDYMTFVNELVNEKN